MCPMDPDPIGVLYGSGRKKGSTGVANKMTLGVSFLAMSAGSGVGDDVGIERSEPGVCKVELVDGIAAGLQLESINIRAIRKRTKSNRLKAEG